MSTTASSAVSSVALSAAQVEAMPPRTLALLYRISSVVARTEDPKRALQSILATLIEGLGATSGSVALVNPDSGKLEIDVHQGLPNDIDEVGLRMGQGITGWVAFHGRPQLVRDVSQDSRYIPLRADVKAEMAAPMEDSGGHILGVINLDSDVINGFDDEDLSLLIRGTQEAASVMTRIWQLRHLKGKAMHLETLISIGQSLVSKLESQELFDTVTRDSRKVASCRACSLHLYDSASQTVRLASLAAVDTIEAEGGTHPIASCLIGAVVHTRKQIEYANVCSPEFFDLVDIPRDPNLRSVLCTPMMIEGEILGVLSIYTDHIHRFNNDEKRLTAALASLAAVALQNSRLYARVFQSEESLRKNEQLTTLGLLAAEIAHEIRNPLTVIKLLYGYLGLDFPEGDPRRTDMRVIGEKLDQLESIVTRVLHFAKAPSSLHSRWSVTDIIDDTIVLIRLKLAQSKIQLRFERPVKPLIVDVHKGQLQQVLLNLLINATQAMPEGGAISMQCSLEVRDSAKVVHIDIVDTGRGVPEALRERIFDSFLSGRPDGTGLGLAIAKRILVSHHGDITLLQTSSEGTTMRVTLPLCS